MEHEFTKRHGFLWKQFNIILTNLAMEGSFDAEGLSVKVDNNLGEIGITH